jgi:hypothetical protein
VSINSSTLVKRTRGAQRKQRLTGLADTSVNETWADRKECVTLSAELNSVLRVDEVQGSLGDSIGHRSGVSGLLDELGITGSARDVDDLLLSSLFDQRKESVGDGDGPNDIGLVLSHRSVNYSR